MLMAHKTEAGWDVLISAGWICRYSTHPVHLYITLYLGPCMYLDSGYVGIQRTFYLYTAHNQHLTCTYHLYIQAQSEYGELVCHVACII